MSESCPHHAVILIFGINNFFEIFKGSQYSFSFVAIHMEHPVCTMYVIGKYMYTYLKSGQGYYLVRLSRGKYMIAITTTYVLVNPQTKYSALELEPQEKISSSGSCY